MVTHATIHALRALGAAVFVAVSVASGVGIVYGIKRIAATKCSVAKS